MRNQPGEQLSGDQRTVPSAALQMPSTAGSCCNELPTDGEGQGGRKPGEMCAGGSSWGHNWG